MREPLLEDELENRLCAGEDPIDLSIEKYERLLDIAQNDEEIDKEWIMSDCCPLCHEYFCELKDYEYNKYHPQCPLEIYGSKCNVADSLWDHIIRGIMYRTDIRVEIGDMIKSLKEIKQRMSEED